MTLARIRSAARGEGVGAILVRGAGSFALVRGLATVLGLLQQVLLARLMGAETFGTFVYALAWLTLLGLLCRAGFDQSSLRFVSSFMASERWGLLRGYLSGASSLVVVCSLAVAAAAAAGLTLAGHLLDPALEATLWVGLLLLPSQALARVWSFMLRALRHVVSAQFAMMVLHPSLLIALLAAAVGLGVEQLGAATGMGLYTGAMVGTLALTLLALGRALPHQLRGAVSERHSREWIGVALPMVAIAGVSLVMQQTGVLMLGALAEPVDVGNFAAASRVAIAITLALQAVNFWATPMIADLHERGQRAELQHLVRVAARLIFGATLVFTLGVVVLGREILDLFGPEFRAGYTALLILCAGSLVNALAGPVGSLMTMTGQQTTAAVILGVNAAANVALSAILVPRYGVEGAAVATAVTTAGWNLGMAVAAWKRLGLRATIW